MKVALVSSAVFPVPPASYGGLERVVYDLAVALHEKGHEVTVVAPKGSNLPEGVELIETIEPQLRVRVNWLEVEGKHYEIYKDRLKDFSIINDHTWFGHIYLAKKDRPELRVVHTHHGEMVWRSLPPVDYPNLIGISNDHALETSRRLGIPVRCAYNPVDLGAHPFKRGRGERLLFLSRIAAIKGAHVAIDVAEKLRVPLDICGGTLFVEDQSYVQRVMQRCDGRLIRFIGDVSHERKVELMQSARALIFPPQPPFREPFGLCPIEANACGCPVVALRNGALSELIKNGFNGYVCDTVEEMERVIREGLIDEVKPENCRRAAKRFSREAATDRYLSLYEDVVNGLEW